MEATKNKVKGKCRFCNARTTNDFRIGLMFSDFRAACSDCQVLTCQGCCYIHSDCERHPPKPRSC